MNGQIQRFVEGEFLTVTRLRCDVGHGQALGLRRDESVPSILGFVRAPNRIYTAVSNCYLRGLDLFVRRSLCCRAYLRYVDDLALFSDSKRELYRWKQDIVDFLQRLRLTVHESSTQVTPVAQGIPWLGFIVFSDHRQVRSRKVYAARQRLGERFEAWRQGWINHVRSADTWRLREQMLQPFTWGAEAYR